MRIASVTATPISVPLVKAETWAYGVRDSMDVVIVEVTTDTGVIGIGEAGAYPSAAIVVEVVNSLASMVVDQDPFRIEHLTRLVDVVATWHHTRFQSPALAAIEMACFDIVGKECGQPVVNLLGGRVRDRMECVYYVSGVTEDELREDAAQGADEGFSVFYVKVAGATTDEDVAAVAAVREGLGARGRIRVDANESWSPAGAVTTLRALEPYGLEFAEQPVSGRALTEMAYVRSRVNVPVLANEASWTRYDQLEVIRRGAADAISIDNQMDGGLLNAKHGASLCEVAGIPVVKHSLGELGVGTTAAAHLICSTPNFRYGHQHYLGRIADDVTTDASRPRISGGCLDVPTAPGLGVELDREKLATYARAYQARERGGFSSADLQETPMMPKR